MPCMWQLSAGTSQLAVPVCILCLQALLLYEEGIPDTAAQRVALAAMTGALQQARLPSESRAALVAKTTAYAARLLRRADQCRAVLACSHMHWQVGAAFCGPACHPQHASPCPT